MSAFEWTDKFLLGYDPMDTTHREFVELVNGLLTCPDDEMAARLAAFVTHAEQHFGDELKWMEATDFPAMQCHADEHAAVLKSTQEVQALVAAGNVEIARKLAAELARWFPGHADYMDSALAHWIVKKRTGGAPLVLKRGIRSAETVD
jgi:hemerythrin